MTPPRRDRGSRSDSPTLAPWLPGVLALLVFVFTFCAFIPALTAGFCDFDDPGFLLLNPFWRGLTWANVEWMFSTTHLGHYQPLTFLSYALEYTLFHTAPAPVMGIDVDLSPVVLHANNILLHALNAVLVFLLAVQVPRLARQSAEQPVPPASDWSLLVPALLAALLWGAHPLRVESVAWITERRDVLSAFFLLGATLAYLRSGTPGLLPRVAERWWLVSIGLLLLSLLSKAWGITFFVIALLLDVWPLRRLPWQPWKWFSHMGVLREKVPFAVLGVIFAAIAAHAQKVASAGQTLKTLDDWGVLARLAQASYGIWFYISRSLVPFKHALIVELPAKFEMSDPRWLVGGGVVLVLGVASLVACRRRPGLGVAILAFLVLVSPVLGFLQSGVQLVAERYAYLALIPLTIALVRGLALLPKPRLAQGGMVVLTLACAAFFTLTWRQCGVWHSTRDLWEQSIASGSQGPMVHNFLGRAMEKTQEYDAALAEYQQSLEADPTFGDSYMGLGLIYVRRGDFINAEKNLLLAEKYLPDPTAAELQLGLLYRRNPATQRETIEAFRRAVATTEKLGNPSQSGIAYLNLASALGEAGDERQAFELLQKAAAFRDTRDEARSLLRQMQGQ